MGHLLVRSSYSVLNGTMSVDDILASAKANHMGYVAITEDSVMFSALEFHQKAKEYGIKPIHGMVILVEGYDLLLLAKDNQGFQALNRLSYLHSKKQEITFEMLKAYSTSLVLVLMVEGGHLENYYQKDDELQSFLLYCKGLFPYIYIGISHQESAYFKPINASIVASGKMFDIQSMALPKVYYRDKDDEINLRVLNAIGQGKSLQDRNLLSHPNRNFINTDEMLALYGKDLVETSNQIAALCLVDLNQLKTGLPVFETNQPVSNAVYLTALAQAGLKKRYGNITQIAQERLDYELSVLNSMNFTDYFLIVYDVIRFAKVSKIYVGPGRGSSASSLVAYCLGITDVDPLKYDLLFERFLNPGRMSMPDIDIDFPDDARQTVIDYVSEKYGEDHAAHILTFGTLQARQVFRDVSRVMGLSTYTVDQGTKLMGQAGLQNSFDHIPRFRRMIESSDLIQNTFNMALKLEGLPRHTSIHAAGIVLSSKPLLDIVGLLHVDDAMPSIQYDMTRIESMGLIKIDFLGLKNLSTIDTISKEIPNFSIQDIPLDDQKTLSILGQGKTTGIFQLESDGMTSLLKKMKPKRFLDVVDAVALYRPGPMQNIPLYLENRELHDFPVIHEDMRSIVESTFGVLIYQEQIMQVSQKMAGFSLAKADILRRAMSKKDPESLNALRQEFMDGSTALGYSSDLALEIFELVLKFASYGFNKSHSVAYGLIAYQLAYLKVNYPLEFYTSLLNSAKGSATKTKEYLDEAKSSQVFYQGPNINYPSFDYVHLDQKIILPLSLIKGIRLQSIEKIKEARREGPFLLYHDTVSRLTIAGIKKNMIESLIDAGALDDLNLSRVIMKINLDDALLYTDIIKVKTPNGYQLNYNLMSEPKLITHEDDENHLLDFEFKVLGFYLSAHPAGRLRDKHQTDAIVDLVPRDGYYRVIASITRIKKHRAKNGKPMAFCVLSDDTADIDSVIFPSTYDKLESLLELNHLVLVKGRMKELGSIIVEDLYRFE